MDLRIIKLPGWGFIKNNSRYTDCAFYSSSVFMSCQDCSGTKIYWTDKQKILNSVTNLSSTGCLVLAKNCERLRTYEMCSVAIHLCSYFEFQTCILGDRETDISFAHANNQIHCIRDKWLHKLSVWNSKHPTHNYTQTPFCFSWQTKW